jgi:hydrogenase expression/formation protein HypC
MCLAIPGQIIEISGEDLTRRARVDFGGIRRDVSLAALPEAKTGDHVLVHAGFALNVVDESEARRTLDDLARMGEQEDAT